MPVTLKIYILENANWNIQITNQIVLVMAWTQWAAVHCEEVKESESD